MHALTRQKITFGEMRAAGVRGLLVYCSVEAMLLVVEHNGRP